MRKTRLSNPARLRSGRMTRMLLGCLCTVLAAGMLAGCSLVKTVADDTANDVQDSIESALDETKEALESTQDAIASLGDAPQALEDMFGSADAQFSKMASAVIYDAQTGEELAVIDDGQKLDEVLTKVKLVELVSSHPDASTAEYQITFSQNETLKLGQSPEELEQVESVTFTTYRDSTIVEIYFPTAPGSFNTFDFEVSQEFVDALRGLAA